ncbi:predicted protein [Streptomyces viridochromogenes DSM 40736]|uniref:Predicted protein n=1 Tax=Streptomyces viridochromogenes (strain DSM 40736 / JCM 4977 / BCRC 1201 / Tue 494) TaxID=591159 RepID=D9X7L3_STRVT|nr:predicted protein [Streptomyces viridochromogenes DSM 40736]
MLAPEPARLPAEVDQNRARGGPGDDVLLYSFARSAGPPLTVGSSSRTRRSGRRCRAPPLREDEPDGLPFGAARPYGPPANGGVM